MQSALTLIHIWTQEVRDKGKRGEILLVVTMKMKTTDLYTTPPLTYAPAPVRACVVTTVTHDDFHLAAVGSHCVDTVKAMTAGPAYYTTFIYV